MKLRILGLIIIGITTLSLKAQMLRGTITDNQHQPIPFSTVFVKELSFGTAANEEGEFELHLASGEYTFVFQCMGYQTVSLKIAVAENNPSRVIILPEMTYSLKEVEVSDGGEDPAYRIMRRVIRKAPLYAAMVKSYTAEVYIRGSLNIRKISSMVKLLARDDLKESNIKEGETYLEESVNEIEFTAPDKTIQNVKSVHSTFPGNEKSRGSGAIGFISGNIYRPDAFGNARSPISPGAFKYYRFRYEGVNTYGDIIVDKIRIIPRGDGPQYLSGYIYVIEGLWCIYSLDVTINEQLGMTIRLNQSYGEVREGAWLPVNNRFRIDMDLLGNSGGFSYNTSIRYKNLIVNPPDYKPRKPSLTIENKPGAKEKRTEERSNRLDKKAEKLSAIENPTTSEAYRLARISNRKSDILKKDSLRHNHEFVENFKIVIDSNARKNDSAFWNKIRPIPLATNEIKSVRGFDSLQFRQSLKVSDSTKKSGAAINEVLNSLVFGGNVEPDTIRSFRTDGLLNPFGVGFNTVDGLVFKTGFSYEQKLHKKAVVIAGFKPGFAFSRQAFLWEGNLNYTTNDRFSNILGIYGGSGSYDYNVEGGASSLENSVATLFFRQNLMRLYHKDFVKLSHSFHPAFGFNLNTSFEASAVKSLLNSSDFSFFYKDERSFKENIPDNPDFEMRSHRDFLFQLSLSYKPMPFYVIKHGVKVQRPGMNNTPTFTLTWKKGIAFRNSDSDFDLILFKIDQRFKTGATASINYVFQTGWFLNKRTLYFDDYRHFQVQPLVVGIKNLFPVMQMGDYYRYSTNDMFAEAHFIYRSSYLFLKRLPLIHSRLWDENLILNYIFVPSYHHCYEIGYSIGNPLYSIGFFSGYENGKFRSAGLRISLSVFKQNQITVGM